MTFIMIYFLFLTTIKINIICRNWIIYCCWNIIISFYIRSCISFIRFIFIIYLCVCFSLIFILIFFICIYIFFFFIFIYINIFFFYILKGYSNIFFLLEFLSKGILLLLLFFFTSLNCIVLFRMPLGFSFFFICIFVVFTFL